MGRDDLIEAVGEASAAIARLDVRVSLSPLREAWQVRASARAAIALSSIDGRPVREADLVAMMSGAALPHASSYLGAGIALAWWQRVLGRVELSDATQLLVGRRTTRTRRAAEDQAEWDGESALSAAARRTLGNSLSMRHELEEDRWAERGRMRALEAMRGAGDGLPSIALGLRDALSIDRDPARHGRVHDLAGIVARQAEERLVIETAGMDDDVVRARRDAMDDMLSSLDWEAPRGLGEAHMAVADRLAEIGSTQTRLSILTGATKRIAVERRGDARAVAGFLRSLSGEATDGLALLAALEATVASWSRTPGLVADRRSSLPDVLWAFLVLPVVDTGWIGDACDLDQRVVQKFVKRLADAGAIEPWAERTAEGLIGRGSSLRLWVARGFAKELARHEARSRLPPAARLSFAQVMDRSADQAGFAPMAEVFARHDREMVEIAQAFGHLWPPRTGADLPPHRS